jgi:hypothetical protein
MAILTSKDDNSVGESISGSSGNPSSANGATVFQVGSGGYSFSVTNVFF